MFKVGKKEVNAARKTQMRVLRWILHVSLRDKVRIRNKDICTRCSVANIVEKVQRLG